MKSHPGAKLAAVRRRLSARPKLDKPTFLQLSLVAILVFIVAGTVRHVVSVGESVERHYGEIAAASSYLSNNLQKKVVGEDLAKTANGSSQVPNGNKTPGSVGNKSPSAPNSSHPSHASLPFSVVDVKMLDVMRLCVSGEFKVFETVYIYDIAFVFSNGDGGQVKVVLDVEGLEGQSPQSYSLTVPHGNFNYRARQHTIEPGAVFIVQPTETLHGAYRVRVRVTSPNSIASAWFENPGVSFEQPCVPAS